MKEQHEGVKRYEKAAMEKRGMRKRERGGMKKPQEGKKRMKNTQE